MYWRMRDVFSICEAALTSTQMSAGVLPCSDRRSSVDAVCDTPSCARSRRSEKSAKSSFLLFVTCIVPTAR